jgi:hypothetical protein
VRQEEECKAWLTHRLCVDWRIDSSRVGRQENLGGGERGSVSAVRGGREGGLWSNQKNGGFAERVESSDCSRAEILPCGQQRAWRARRTAPSPVLSHLQLQDSSPQDRLPSNKNTFSQLLPARARFRMAVGPQHQARRDGGAHVGRTLIRAVRPHRLDLHGHKDSRWHF